MIVGTDTGYFIHQVNGHARALQLWRELEAGQHIFIVSTLTLNELLVYSYKRGIHQERAKQWLSLLQETNRIEVVPVSIPIALRSAPYRYSLGLSTIDAIILATFVEAGCQFMITADGDFQTAHQQNLIKVEVLT